MLKKALFATVLVAVSMVTSLNSVAQPNEGAVLPVGKKFIIQSAVHHGRASKGYWEKPGGGNTAQKGDNLRVWALDKALTKRFTLVESKQSGWFEIYPANDKDLRVDVAGGKTSNGTNIGLWSSNGSSNQRFLFKHLGNGRYKIYAASGSIINLESQSADNGTNIQLWRDHDGIHNEWFLMEEDYTPILPLATKETGDVPLIGDEAPRGKFYIQSAMSFDRNDKGYLEFPFNNGNWAEKGNKLKINTKSSSTPVNAMFRFVKPDKQGYYLIESADSQDFAMDIAGGKTDKGTPVHGWTKNENNPNQHFYLKHLGGGRYKIYHKSGKVVCLKDNKNDNNGNPVHLWDDHNSISTEWHFISAEDNKGKINKQMHIR